MTAEIADRLDEEGISDLSAMATADPFKLMRNTSFTMRQIVSWIDEAILIATLPKGWAALEDVGLTGAVDLGWYARPTETIEDALATALSAGALFTQSKTSPAEPPDGTAEKKEERTPQTATAATAAAFHDAFAAVCCAVDRYAATLDRTLNGDWRATLDDMKTARADSSMERRVYLLNRLASLLPTLSDALKPVGSAATVVAHPPSVAALAPKAELTPALLDDVVVRLYEDAEAQLAWVLYQLGSSEVQGERGA